MRLLAFSVYDTKTGAFIQPFFDQAKGSAIRAFTDAVNDENHQFHRHAADYTLYHVGIFDQDTGELKAVEPVDNLGNALTFIIGDNG